MLTLVTSTGREALNKKEALWSLKSRLTAIVEPEGDKRLKILSFAEFSGMFLPLAIFESPINFSFSGYYRPSEKFCQHKNIYRNYFVGIIFL